METLNKGMTKAEMVLKAVMAEISNPEEFVEHCLFFHISGSALICTKTICVLHFRRPFITRIRLHRTPESSRYLELNSQLFTKNLEMRLIRRSDQLQIIQLYRSRFESQTTTPSGSAPLSISAVIGESSSIKRLEKFVRRI